MAKFQMLPVVSSNANRITARIRDAAAGQDLGDADMFKLVKMVGDSQYGLCADTNQIEGFLVSVSDPVKHDGFVLGTVQTNGRFIAVADGAVAVLDQVVAGTPVARGTKMTAAGPKVKKVGSGVSSRWRVVSILEGSGNGAKVVVESMY